MADMSHLSSSGPPGCLRTSLQAVVSSVVEHKLLAFRERHENTSWASSASSSPQTGRADRTSTARPHDLVLGRWR